MHSRDWRELNLTGPTMVSQNVNARGNNTNTAHPQYQDRSLMLCRGRCAARKNGRDATKNLSSITELGIQKIGNLKFA